MAEKPWQTQHPCRDTFGRLFPIISASQCLQLIASAASAVQHLVIIRHGESEFNRAVDQQPGFRDPMIFDPHLTALGREQVRV